ncbi:hypothetical protein [Peribacillus frigoritolerans]|uniref:hypothetical protein n=1 Tax=Peribacillus frigoritolerans TaxID=450367 RepID=UPI0021A99D0A|nr:hypothetical protein [Peribacillus frigoritolerans]
MFTKSRRLVFLYLSANGTECSWRSALQTHDFHPLLHTASLLTFSITFTSSIAVEYLPNVLVLALTVPLPTTVGFWIVRQ